jgi:hypothetical protein
MIKLGWWDDLKIKAVWDGNVTKEWRWTKILEVLSNPSYKCAGSVSVAGEINENR